jgi:hypothetical protein
MIIYFVLKILLWLLDKQRRNYDIIQRTWFRKYKRDV